MVISNATNLWHLPFAELAEVGVHCFPSFCWSPSPTATQYHLCGHLSTHNATRHAAGWSRHCQLGVPSLSPGAPHDGARGKEIMEVQLMFWIIVCTLIGVSIGLMANNEFDSVVKEVDQAVADREAMGRAIGHE